MNIVLDTYTDIQMLFRWVIAILVGLLITVWLSQWFNKRRRQDARMQTTPSP